MASIQQSDFTKEAKTSMDFATLHISKGEAELNPVMTIAEETKLVRKIDLHLIPLMFVLYLFQYLDKTSLGYTAIMGILQDAELDGTQYSWVSSFFYVGFLAASPLASILLVKLSVAKVVVVTVIVWASIQICMAAGNSFGRLAALRILLGAFEAAVNPGFTIITSMWYKPSEHALRHGLWYGGASVAYIFGGVLAYAISHIHSAIKSWQFGSVVLNSFGYSVLQTQLLTMSQGAFLLIFVVFTVIVSIVFKNARCVSIALLNIISLAGALMTKLLPESHKLGRLGGLWLISAYASAFPTILSLVSNNITGHTKKSTVNAMLFVGFCVGYIVGPLTFLPREAPSYETAFNTMIACFVLNVVIIMIMRQLMAQWNKKRDQEFGAETNESGPTVEDNAARVDLDETDWENKSIRYSL